MCAWCCGGVPLEDRGEGHKHCGETCYNAPRSGAIDKARAEGRTEVVDRDAGIRALVDALAWDWDTSPGDDPDPNIPTPWEVASGVFDTWIAAMSWRTEAEVRAEALREFAENKVTTQTAGRIYEDLHAEADRIGGADD